MQKVEKEKKNWNVFGAYETEKTFCENWLATKMCNHQNERKQNPFPICVNWNAYALPMLVPFV